MFTWTSLWSSHLVSLISSGSLPPCWGWGAAIPAEPAMLSVQGSLPRKSCPAMSWGGHANSSNTTPESEGVLGALRPFLAWQDDSKTQKAFLSPQLLWCTQRCPSLQDASALSSALHSAQVPESGKPTGCAHLLEMGGDSDRAKMT